MDVIVIGAGGHGKVVVEVLRAEGKHRPIGFLDADPSVIGQTIAGLPVLGAINHLNKLKQQNIRGGIVAIGDNRTRQSYAKLLVETGFELVTAVHPMATVSPSATLGKNVLVAAGAIIGAEAKIGDSVIVNTGAIVDHECRIDAGVHICPAAALAGRVYVQSGAFVGLGARIIQCLTVGSHAIIGAGAVVVRDVPADVTVVGVPAMVLKQSTRAA